MLTRHSSMTSPGQQREPTSPLPEGAVVSDLVMWVDGTAVHGEILEADEAGGQAYETVPEEGSDSGYRG